MIDTQRIGDLTAQVMHALQRYDGEQWRIQTVAMIVELDSEASGELVVKCSETRAWVMEAFLGEAYDTVQRIRRGDTVREDDE